MWRKRMEAVLLTAVFAAGILSGCGKQGNSTVSKESEQLNAGTEKSGIAGELDGNGITDGTQDSDWEERADTQMQETQSALPQQPEYSEIIVDGTVEDYGSVVVVNNAAYELYTYLDNEAENYAKSVNQTAETLDGRATVYDMVIPLGSGIVFPDNLQAQIKSTDQREAMLEIQEKMSSKVTSVDIYDALMAHRSEYIYFRTDHHWTALGAYYAYEQFCEAKGIEPEAIDSYETKEFDGFLGSFFNDTNKAKALGDNPDVVTAYVPNMNAVCHVTDSRGVEYDSPVVYDETNAAPGLKYSAFIAGDNPYTVIENKELTDGSSCVVVKESFGNAFVPFLVDHYQTIYVVDYRYWTGNVSELAIEKGAGDVIFLNNLSMIRNKSLIGKLYRVV